MIGTFALILYLSVGFCVATFSYLTMRERDGRSFIPVDAIVFALVMVYWPLAVTIALYLKRRST
jgi:hypothetical protein